jgi:hypothetical protein
MTGPRAAMSSRPMFEQTPPNDEQAVKRRDLRQLLHQIDLDEQLRLRAVQQAILQAQAWWWRWRAEQFHQARPRNNEYHGQATMAELWEAWNRCNETAQACLNKADLLEWEAES